MKSNQPLHKTPRELSNFLTVGLSAVALSFLGSPAAHAANSTWNGLGGTNDMNLVGNWTAGLPTNDADTATWDGTQAGNLSLLWTAQFGPGFGSVQGINLNIAATNTGSLQLDASAAGINFALGNITIAAGAGAFTFGNGSGTANVVIRANPSTWTNNSSNTATIKSDVVFANGGGAGVRTLIFSGSGNWSAEGTLVSSAAFGTSVAGAAITKNGSGTLTLGGVNENGGLTTINGGTLATGAAGNIGANISLTNTSGVVLTLGNNASLGNAATLSFGSLTVINLNFGGADTLGALTNTTTSTSLTPGTYNASQLNTFFYGVTTGTFTGTGSLTVAAVPEPSTTAAAFTLGLGLLVALRMRRKRAEVRA